MNSISGKISKIEAEGSFRLITILAKDKTFKAIIIDNDVESYAFKEPVLFLFKETEVSVATGPVDTISLQNQVSGTIRKLEKGKLLTRVVLETDFGPIASIITTDSAERLQLAEGRLAYALIKTNEVMISKE